VRGCLSTVIVLLVFVAIINSCSHRASNNYGENSGATHTPVPRHAGRGWDHKAVAGERNAARLAGGFDNATRKLYHLGLQHVRNQHGNIGTFTIGQVVDQERSREDARATEARVQLQREADARARNQRAVIATEERNYMHGTPECLVFDRRSLSTSSDEYTWHIRGKVKNTCGRNLRYVQVSFSFYDTSGNLENSGLVNMNNLDAGETWAFNKSVYEPQSSGGTFRLTEITGF
jgi:hypothetical protein